MFCRVTTIALAASALAGCTVWTSETLDQVAKADRAPRGVMYALPKGVVTVTLTVLPSRGTFDLEFSEVQHVPDPELSYVLRYTPHPSYTDDVDVKTKPNGLLELVNSKTKDQTPGVVVNLARLLAGGGGISAKNELDKVESNEGGGAKAELLKVTIDPLDDTQRRKLIGDMNTAMIAYRDARREDCAPYVERNARNGRERDSKNSTFKRTRDALTAQLRDTNVRVALTEGQLLAAAEALEAAKKNLQAKSGTLMNVPPLAPHRTPARSAQTRAPGDYSCIADGLPELVRVYCDALARQAEASALSTEAINAVNSITTRVSMLDAQQQAHGFCPVYANMSALPPVHISVHPFEEHGHTPGQADLAARIKAPKADCTIGVCYRPKQPFRLEYAVGAGRRSRIIEVPNESEIVAIDITRAFLVQKMQNITFDDGYLRQIEIDKKSELLAAAKLPIDVLSAVADSLKIRVDTTTKRKELATKQLELLNAQKALAGERAKQVSEVAGKAATTESSIIIPARPAQSAARSRVVP
jgi:hypothetical protein